MDSGAEPARGVAEFAPNRQCRRSFAALPRRAAPPELPRRHDAAKTLPARACRIAAPMLASRYVRDQAASGRDHRALADGEVVGNSDLATEHHEITDHAAAGNTD